MVKVFCGKCKNYSVGTYGGGADWFIFNNCNSVQNKFLETTTFNEHYIEKKPSDINKNNDCTFYEEASVEAIECSNGKFSGPYEFYHKSMYENKIGIDNKEAIKKSNWFIKLFKE
jgi:hypothetical protein